MALSGNLLSYNDESVETSLNTTSFAGSGLTVAWSTAQAKEGTHSVKCTLTSTSGPYLALHPAGSTSGAATATTCYFWVYATVAGATASIEVDYHDSTGAYVGYDSFGKAGKANTPLAVNAWTQVELGTLAPPAATAAPYVYMYFQGSTGDVFYTDEHFYGTPPSGPPVDQAALSWTSDSAWALSAVAARFAALSLTADSQWSLAAAVSKLASASWTADSSWTLDATVVALQPSASWSSDSSMSIDATVTHYASMSWSSDSSLGVTPVAQASASLSWSSDSSWSLTATVIAYTPPPPGPGVVLATQPPPVYRLCIADTRTGQVMADLPFTGTPSWSRQINAAGALSNVTVPLYPTLDSDTLTYMDSDWRYTLIWAYGHRILQAGLITGETVDDSQNPAVSTLSTMTVWDLLSKKRPILNMGHAITDAAADVVFSSTSPDPANQNLSWGSVARRLVQIGTSYDGDPAYSLPIVLPDPTSGTATITYAAADEKFVGQELTNLTQQDNGPEIEFSPEWTDSTQTFFQWRMRVGTRLGQLGFPFAYDYQKALQYLKVTRDGTAMTFGVWAKGQDNRSSTGGTLTWASSTDATKPNEGWPWLLTADTMHSSETSVAVVQSYANADVAAGMNPVYSGEATLRMDGRSQKGAITGSPSVDALSIGDTTWCQVAGHPRLPDGRYAARILTLASGQDIETAAASLQVIGTA